MTMTPSQTAEQATATKNDWTLLKESFKHFLSSKLNRFSFGLTMCLLLLIVIAPFVAIYPYDEINPALGLSPPSWEHPMGTDQAGRDVFSRVIYGARTSLSIGLVTVLFGVGRQALSHI